MTLVMTRVPKKWPLNISKDWCFRFTLSVPFRSVRESGVGSREGCGVRKMRNFPKWSDMVVHEIITAHFGGHIEPIRKVPGNFPGNGAAATAIDIMVADSMIYNDHFY